MRIHHLNCGTMRILGGAAVIGGAGPLNRARGVTHCILAETDDGLLLIDTGVGTRDYTHPSLMMRWAVFASSMPRRLEETAVAQVRALGYTPEDVRHIVLTHCHMDHTGGLPDFPRARVHIFAEEYAGVVRPRDVVEWGTFRREHFAHGPDWTVHGLEGDRWFDFDCTRPVDLGSTRFCLVPLPGHSRGHCGVALQTPDGWLFHCGDAYGYHREVDPVNPAPPPYQHTVRPFFNVLGIMRAIGRHNARLQALLRTHGDKVQITNAHDPVELEKFLPPRVYPDRVYPIMGALIHLSGAPHHAQVSRSGPHP
ncbi:MAG: MBL fold metallo-hydrolase [Anaerolineae bacterium]